jgi:hypothetical protein
LRHHHVEDDEIDGLTAHAFKAFPAAESRAHGVAVVGEQNPDKFDKIAVVVDDENLKFSG